jgi:hypothetical protein
MEKEEGIGFQGSRLYQKVLCLSSHLYKGL